MKPYLSFGAEIKTLTPEIFEELPRPAMEIERLKTLHQALTLFRKTDSLSFGFDARLFAMSLNWSEDMDRDAILALLHPESADPLVQAFYEHAHALVLGSDGKRHELMLLRFVANEQIEPYLYTFFKEYR